MIKFAPFVEYKMDKCYLTKLECIALIVIEMEMWEKDDACKVIDALFDMHWSHRFSKYLNQTVFCFGGKEDSSYTFTAVFKFTPDHEQVELFIYRGLPEDEEVWYHHVFDNDEDMEFVDYLTYKEDPKRLEDFEDDWELK